MVGAGWRRRRGLQRRMKTQTRRIFLAWRLPHSDIRGPSLPVAQVFTPGLAGFCLISSGLFMGLFNLVEGGLGKTPLKASFKTRCYASLCTSPEVGARTT